MWPWRQVGPRRLSWAIGASPAPGPRIWVTRGTHLCAVPHHGWGNTRSRLPPPRFGRLGSCCSWVEEEHVLMSDFGQGKG